jgi:hypothetical protein
MSESDIRHFLVVYNLSEGRATVREFGPTTTLLLPHTLRPRRTSRIATATTSF